MNKEEADNLLKQIFPIGEERYIKVKYHDFEKCVKTFRLSPPNQDDLNKFIEEYGFEVTSIGIRPEFEPQVSALVELRDELLSESYRNMGGINQEAMVQIINNKILEVINKNAAFPL